MSDNLFMRRALALAEKSAGPASPNPTVGCVIVKDGQVVGEGFHSYDKLDHAEIVALRHAGENAARATVYVTLEPCCHYGRTGPCTDALIAADVSRVVVATEDPNPRVAGKGIAQLRDAKIRVEIGLLGERAQRLNDAYARYITTGQPFVLLKCAVSLDGRIAPAHGTLPQGERFRVTGAAAHARVHAMRNRADAILTGIGTVLADDALLTDRSGLQRSRPLLRVVLDSHLRMPLDGRLARSAKDSPVLLCYHHASQEKVDRLRGAGIDLFKVESRGGLVSASAVLRHLAKQEITGVLVEAGAQLTTHVLSSGLADQVALFYAPIVLGANAIPLFVSRLPEPLRLKKISVESVGTDTLVSGFLRDPWPLNLQASHAFHGEEAQA
jgi:diaminohydroxyphosphoribosylaminopyrimidine deaminase/5-amino-6-(5-phosphoribosylamino)uracil reductase